MLQYILRRIAIIIPLLFAISIISFIVIVLPPQNYVDTYARNLQEQGYVLNQRQIHILYAEFGLDRPLPVQYFIWVKNFVLHGDLGRSFIYNRPVRDIILERLPASLAISILSLALTWAIAVPVGVYSALRQHSAGDYLATGISFVGLALPNFLLALVLAYVVFASTGHAITSLFSPEYARADWSWGKLLDLLSNVWLPIVVIAVSGTAALIRILRATLLDEKNKQYVVTARAKGLNETRLIMKYPVRVAINPLVSTIGWTLPYIISGEIIVSKVLNLDTLGPILLNAALAEDMYLVGSIVMILSALTVLGTLLSDLLLAWLDPRIRFDRPRS